MRRSARTRLLPGVLILLALPGCASAPAAGSGESLRVYAAASLQEVMTPLAQEFTARTGVEIQLSSAGSADLLAQLEQGAPADVFIPADEPTMDRAERAALIAEPAAVIASNTLVIAVPAGNPAQITDLADLADPAHALVLCAPQVPCGTLAHQVARTAEVTLRPASEELSVTEVLGKVRSAEADAGLVYSSDALRAEDEVDTLVVPEAAEFPNRYPAAVLSDSEQPELAEQFIELLLSTDGQTALDEAGFIPETELEGG